MCVYVRMYVQKDKGSFKNKFELKLDSGANGKLWWTLVFCLFHQNLMVFIKINCIQEVFGLIWCNWYMIRVIYVRTWCSEHNSYTTLDIFSMKTSQKWDFSSKKWMISIIFYDLSLTVGQNIQIFGQKLFWHRFRRFPWIFR